MPFVVVLSSLAFFLGFHIARQDRGSGPSTEWELLFQDQFSGSELSECWLAKGGNWSARGGELTASSNKDALLLLDLPISGDVRIECQAICVKEGVYKNLEAALFCNASKRYLTADGYFASLGSTDGVKLQRRDVNMVVVGDRAPQNGVRHHLRLERVGAKVTFYVDGVKTAQYQDSMPIEGGLGREYVGLYLWNAQTRFSDLRVYGRRLDLRVSVVERGNVLFERGDFQGAMTEYARINRLYPNTSEGAEAAYREALCLSEWAQADMRKRGRPYLANADETARLLRAAPLFEKLMIEAKPPWKQHARAARAEIAWVLKDYATSLNVALAGAEDDPLLREAIRPLLGRYVSLLNDQSFKEAELCISALERLYPAERAATARIVLNYAQILARMGRFIQGRMVFERILREYPELKDLSLDVLARTADIYEQEYRFDDALKVLDRLAAEKTERRDVVASTFIRRARIFQRQNDPVKASALLDEALLNFTDQPEQCAAALVEKMQIFRKQRRLREMEEAFSVLLKRYAEYRVHVAKAQMTKAGALTDMRDFKLAEEILLEVERNFAELQEIVASAMTSRSWVYAQERRLDEVLHLCDEILKRFPNNDSVCAQSLLRKGLAFERMRRPEEAIKYFDRVLETYPALRSECATAIIGKSWQLNVLGQSEKALRTLAESRFQYESMASHQARAWKFEGVILRSQRKYEEAVKAFEVVAYKYPDQEDASSSTLLLLAETLWYLGRFDKAIGACETVLNVYPYAFGDHVQAQTCLGDVYSDWGLWEKAWDAYAKLPVVYAAAGFESAGVELVYQSRVRFGQGRFDEAWELLEKAAAAGGERAEIRFDIFLLQSDIYHSRGQHKEAMAVLDGLLRMDAVPANKQAEAIVRQGRILAATGKMAEALECFNQVLLQFPKERDNCAPALLEKGVVLRRQGRFPEAEEVLAKVYREYTDCNSVRTRAVLEIAVLRIKSLHKKALPDEWSAFSEQSGNWADIFRLAAEKMDSDDETDVPDGIRRNDYELAKALLNFSALKYERAVKHISLCIETTCGEGRYEWPALSAIEILSEFKKIMKQE